MTRKRYRRKIYTPAKKWPNALAIGIENRLGDTFFNNFVDVFMPYRAKARELLETMQADIQQKETDILRGRE